MDRPPARTAGLSSNRRLYIWYGVLLFIISVIVLRLFYLQIVRHDYYQKAALSDQLKQYSIAAERGLIEAKQGNGVVPLVLNQKLYTLYADPSLVKNPSNTSDKLAAVTKGDASKYQALVKTKNSRYVILAKRLSEDQNKQIAALKLPGIGLQAIDYRTYPQGALAAQLLGFVNNDGKGTYGVEQALNKSLSGTPGQLKAITDASGVPLAASRDNVQINPKAGDNVVLTIDLAMQQQLEKYLAQDLKNARSTQGSALIIDPNTGAVKAMANLPSYDPGQYFNVTDGNLFNNPAVSEPFEIGSIMKTLTASAALNQGVVNLNTSFYDPGHWDLNGSTVKNVEEDGGAGPSNLAKILNLSMNTGATWLLMQMGHETGAVNQTARDKWYDYMTNHFHLGKPTGIEQGYEAGGYVPKPDQGYALQLTYANTSFGQAMTATPLQMAAALSSVLNGGTYYQPRLVDETAGSNGKNAAVEPKVLAHDVVSAQVAQQMQGLMAGVVQTKVSQGFKSMVFPGNYTVGGKTGTAQIADPAGGYYGDRFNGTFIGFVGGDKPQYVIMVAIKQPKVGGYAGTSAAMPLFADLAHMLINNFNVAPKTGS
jgi:cell division protein FtsI/penicillin-binding protein 2